MTRRNLFLVMMVVALSLLTSVQVYATPMVIPLEVRYNDPSHNQDNPGRTPALIPQVSIEIHTLYFGTSCDGYTLQIVDENDDVVYSTVIPATGQLVHNDSSSGATKRINISGWTTGIYLLCGKAGDNIVTRKITIK